MSAGDDAAQGGQQLLGQTDALNVSRTRWARAQWGSQQQIAPVCQLPASATCCLCCTLSLYRHFVCLLHLFLLDCVPLLSCFLQHKAGGTDEFKLWAPEEAIAMGRRELAEDGGSGGVLPIQVLLWTVHAPASIVPIPSVIGATARQMDR